MAVSVPELRKKLNILIAYGCYSDWDAIAVALGKSPKTIQWWADGAANREPNAVPKGSFQKLVDLFSSALPAHRPDDEVRKLILGPASELESEFRAAPTISLAGLIEDEAINDAGSIIRADRSNMELVESEPVGDAPEPDAVIKLNEWFRVVFRSSLHGQYVLAMQNVQQTWGGLAATFEAESRSIYLPGLNEASGRPVFMREVRDRGTHRFVVMQTAEPTPVDLRSAFQDRVAFDKSLLDRAATFYASQPKSRRCLFLLELKVE